MSKELSSNGKDDLPIRPYLVDIAVGFLSDTNVQQRPDNAKIAFLKKKGLTDSEIAEAFKRIKYSARCVVDSEKNYQMINPYPLYQPVQSFWFHLRSYSSAFVSFAIAVYLLHRFYKSYIEPWFFESKSDGNELSALKQQLIELNSSVSQLASIVASLQDAVNNQAQRIERSALYDVELIPITTKDILNEVSNVKGLLLNRFSFPAPPTIVGATTENKTQSEEPKTPSKAVTIPKWQLRDSMEGKSQVNSEQIEKREDSSEEKLSSGLIAVENNLSQMLQDQENSLKIVKDEIQHEDFETASENNVESLEDRNGNYKACLKNNLSAKDKTQDEVSEMASKNLTRDVKENGCGTTFEINGRIDDSMYAHVSAVKSE